MSANKLILLSLIIATLSTHWKNCIQIEKGRCKQCIGGYQLNERYRCQPQHCGNYDEGAGECEQCDSSYRLDEYGLCNYVMSKTLVIGLAVGISLAVAIVVGVVIIVCNRKRLREAGLRSTSEIQQTYQNPEFGNLPNLLVAPSNQPHIPYIENTELSLPDPGEPLESHMYPNNESLYRHRDICTICLAKKTNIRTSCSHQFHTQCIVQWCKRKYVCPDCNNDKFRLMALCSKCRQFKNNIRICAVDCRSPNHMTCFNKLNRPACSGCSKKP